MKTKEEIEKSFSYWSEEEKMTLDGLIHQLDILKESDDLNLDTLRSLENIECELGALTTNIRWRIIHILQRGDRL